MYRKGWTVCELNKIISVIVIHLLDLLLFLVLLPFMVWEWISKRPYVITILRAIIEVKKFNIYLIFWLLKRLKYINKLTNQIGFNGSKNKSKLI